MLGMLRTATPSIERPLRSKEVPQHWKKYSRPQKERRENGGKKIKRSFFELLQVQGHEAHLQFCCLLTSIVILSFSFLQEADMVSEVANSKYHSLFFILQLQKACLLSVTVTLRAHSNVSLWQQVLAHNSLFPKHLQSPPAFVCFSSKAGRGGKFN